MKLDKDINYIVSGLERSGTSLIMQILEANDIPLGFDDERPPDEDNPNGYYELYKGKIITKLKEGKVPFDNYKGKFVKITAYGLRYLPEGNYRILFMTRNVKEIIKSANIMHPSDHRNEILEETFEKLLDWTKKHIKDRDDIKLLYVDYNRMLTNPDIELKKMQRFLGCIDIEDSKEVIDQRLYRNREQDVDIEGVVI